MFRLRTTTALSLLALAVGIAGTHWLSQRSTDEPLALPSKRASTVAAHASPARSPKIWRGPVRTLPRSIASGRPAVPAWAPPPPIPAVSAPEPELVPLDMPAPRDASYDSLRGHLDGRVIVHVRVDGSGHVIAASVAESSGDAVLDAHALVSIRGWRFAVPPDHPDGLSGDLPMRFSSHADPVASVP